MKNSLLRFLMIAWVMCMVVLPVQAADSQIHALTLTWTGDAKTTQTITWQTDVDSDSNCVQYSEADTPDVEISSVNVIKAKTSSFTTNEDTVSLHTVTLAHLKPDTRYVYRIGNGEQWVRDGMFKTEGLKSEFKFLLFGDSQSANYDVWKTTFHNAYQNNRTSKFFVNVGDLVDNGQKNEEWRNWFQAVAAYSGQIPAVPVVGNHETYTLEGNFSLPVYFTKQFMLPQNGPDGLKGQVYSFDYGDVHFVILDSQFGEERQFLPDSLSLQKEWLAQDLAATDKLWKIVFMHRPAYHNRIKESQPDATAQFVPIFDQYGVDAVFSGHDHVNARTPKLKAGEPLSSGTIYSTAGRSGTKTYDTVGSKEWNEQFFNPVDQPTYTVAQVAGNVFYVQVFKQDGTLVDEWSLTKIH